MENLSLHDQPTPSASAVPNNVPPPGPTQLPPQVRPSGPLTPWGMEPNLMLQETVERIYTKDVYADIQRGIYIVRGENVLLLGEIVRCPLEPFTVNPPISDHPTWPQDLDKDDYIPEPYRKASPEEVHQLHLKEMQESKSSEKTRQSKLKELGFEVEHNGEILL
ncbi:MAG: hypothetical protein Q9195_000601 [Heterodermia aff. obscurata]